MKIEKINDNQIRCTLTKEDLDRHHIRLSELAYGTEKAKQLFRDMMQQAQQELGFESDNTPLMIEAIPVNADSIILIITKVDDPEELDTRFSKFAPAPDTEQEERKNEMLEKLEGAEEILDLLSKVRKAASSISGQKDSTDEISESGDSVRLFSFGSMDSVILAAHLLGTMYSGSNTLYKDVPNDIYILALSQSDYTTNDFNKLCNMLTEYGSLEKASSASLAYLEEHCQIIVSKNAIQQLATI